MAPAFVELYLPASRDSVVELAFALGASRVDGLAENFKVVCEFPDQDTAQDFCMLVRGGAYGARSIKVHSSE